MQEQFQIDREKFKEAIHYVVDYVNREHGPDTLGNTKLHKVLYYSDMLHYLDTGRPLTGVDYQRQRFGPTARHLTQSLRELQSEGSVATATVNYYGFAKSEYRSLRPAAPARLSEANQRLLERMADFVCVHTATEISEFSHDMVWESVPMGARIPYYASFAMFPVEITPEEIEDAEDEAERLAPIIEAEQRHGGGVR